jgi:ArsR family transcriptional regulator
MPDTTGINIAQLQSAAAEATALLKSLANEERLLLLCQLSQGEYCVSDLETRLGIYQPTLSQQLAVLRNQELVSTRREGKQVYYRLSDPKAMAVLQTLYALFCGSTSGGRHAD